MRLHSFPCPILQLTFVITDTGGDGLCCGSSCGYYAATVGDALVAGTDLDTTQQFSTVAQTFALWSPTRLDSARTAAPTVCALINVTVVPDSQPQQTAWRLTRAADGSVIAAGSASGAILPSYCAPRGEQMVFAIYDSGGDGLCCSYGNGSFVFTVGGTVLSVGAQLSSVWTTQFGFMGPPPFGTGVPTTVQGRIDIPAGSPSAAAAVTFAATSAFGRTSTPLAVSYQCGTTPSVTPSPSPSYTASATAMPSASPASFVTLNSAANYVSFAKSSALNFGAATSFTVALYLKATAWTNDPSFIGDKNWGSGSNAGWIIAGSSSGTLRVNLCDGSSANKKDIYTTLPVNDGGWHLVAMVVDRSAGAMVVYMDGVFAQSVSLGSLGSVTTSYPIAVGQDGTLAYAYGLSGTSIDEVRIWNRAMSASDMTALAVPLCVASTATPPYSSNLLVRLQLSEQSGSVTANSGTLGGTASVVGGSSVWASALSVCATAPSSTQAVSMTFVGSSGYVAIAKPSSLNFGSTTSFTAALYVRVVAPTAAPVLVGDKNWNSGSNAGWVLSMNGGSLWANVGDGTNRVDIKPSFSVADGQWHHVALVVDRSSGLLATLYVDGYARGSATSTTIGSITTTYMLGVGQDGTLTYGDPHASTSIDEVRVWNRAMSSADVSSLAVSTCVGTAAGASVPYSGNLLVRLQLSEGLGSYTANSGVVGGYGAVRGVNVWAVAASCLVQ